MEISDIDCADYESTELEFEETVREQRELLLEKTDGELLSEATRIGPDLNDVTDHFPAYDVARKLKKNGWTPTEKQRKAIVNVMAWLMATRVCSGEIEDGDCYGRGQWE